MNIYTITINRIKDKLDTLAKVAVMMSIGLILIQLILRIIFNIDWFSLEVSQRISNFFLLQNNIVQIVINKGFLFLNYVLVTAIVTTHTVKYVFKKVWWVILIAVLIDFIATPISMLVAPILGLIITIVYNTINNKSTLNLKRLLINFIIVTISLLLYQIITLILRFNGLDNVASASFYEELVYIFDMYILYYFIYRLRLKGEVCIMSWFWIGNIGDFFEKFFAKCKKIVNKIKNMSRD